MLGYKFLSIWLEDIWDELDLQVSQWLVMIIHNNYILQCCEIQIYMVLGEELNIECN